MSNLSGTSLAGGTGEYGRVKDDFYATDKNSVRDLMNLGVIKGDVFLEPCVGQGHIADVIKEFMPECEVIGQDIVDRGYPNTIVGDFLEGEEPIYGYEAVCDWVVTNPPFKDAKRFISKSLELSEKGVAMFLKIQFLEGQSRKEWFKTTPLKYVYVFSKRQDPLRDGMELNPKTGKRWGSTMCFAWFIWEHGYNGEPMIRWI